MIPDPALLALLMARARWREWPVALWFAFPALYTVFGTSTPSAWRPLLPYPRYLIFAALPAAMIAARLLADGMPRETTRGETSSTSASGSTWAACRRVRSG